ncbi:hypothetical protein QOZ84_06995 [Romboutsia sedimentorum]|uniref:Uncharacterized protein n=1 Tax=Romboutsia sedimentorum TaxID=1368474 RepID=A0ABT7ECU6_9FIRM|nr:hypothetical protein [Romboutsia sedimentorum]MDK2563290.1 hypothetical protein [Romboutsia sedimentorum]
MIKKYFTKRYLFSLLCTLIIISFIIQINRIPISEAISNRDTIELTPMQSTFLKIATMKEENIQLKKSDIESMINKFELKGVNQRTIDVISTYSHNNENISIYTTSLDNSSKVEGIIYKMYDPSKKITMLRSQYSDFEKDGKYIRLEVSSNSIDEIDKLAIKLNAKFINTNLYSDYLSIYNRICDNSKLNIEDLTKINSKFKPDTDHAYKNDTHNNFKLDKDNFNAITLDTNKSTNEFLDMNLNSFLNVKGEINDLSKTKNDNLCTTLISKLDKKGLEYYNFSNEDNLGHTLMLFKGNSKELKEVFLQTINFTK